MDEVDRLEELLQLLDNLESKEFDTHVNLASGRHLARAIALSNPTVIRIMELVRLAPEWDRHILGRIREVSSREIESGYESPWDVTLFSLLLILDREDSQPELKIGMEIVMGSPGAHGLFWARQEGIPWS